jgi:chromosome segregation ATPase
MFRNKELDSWYSHTSSSGEEDEVQEGAAFVDNTIETRMAQDRGSPLPYTRRCMAGQIVAKRWEREARKLEEEDLRDQFRDAWALKEDVDKVTEEGGAVTLEAQINAEITGQINKENEALKLKTKELRTQCEERGKLEKQLQSLMQKCKDITGERDALLLHVQVIAKERDRAKEQRDALQLETKNLLAQHKDVALLEKELKAVRVQCDNIARERDSLKLRSRRSEADCKAMSKNIEALKVEMEEIRAQYKGYALLKQQLDTEKQHCQNITKERNAFILRAQKIAESRGTMQIERDALKLTIENLRSEIKDADLLEEKLNATRLHCDNITKERDLYKSKALWLAEDREAMMEYVNSLELELKELGAQCKISTELVNQLMTVSQHCDNIEKQRDIYEFKDLGSAQNMMFMR